MKSQFFYHLSFLCVILMSCDSSKKEEEHFNVQKLHVQDFEVGGEPFSYHAIRLENADQWQGLVSRTPIRDYLSSSASDGLFLKIEWDEGPPDQPQNLAGAYELNVSAEGINLTARDSVGVFYGLQTLNQLIGKTKILPVAISDYPAFPYRGVVEGFYGTPWSTEDRIRQIEFYGRVKANTYIYGPKDDPFHSSPHWRKAYPEDQAENIKRLVKVAHANFVDFVWAIHPGKDIKWNDEDRDNVLKKFQHMYDLGVRSFALFFDDISGEGTSAQKQAELLNFLTEEFVKVKKDVKPLILTPTDYNKGWANPGPDGYLSVLGRELDPSVQIMWTGDNVMSDVTKSTADWVKERIKRPSLIWWNFPVSDYQRNRLFLEPSYGLEENLTADDISGVLSNPMEHAEASKPAISGVADYGWNAKKYDARKSWEQSIQNMLPESYQSYIFFADNNGTPNTDLTSHRDRESEALIPLAERVKEALKNSELVLEEDLDTLVNYFQKIQKTEKEIIDAHEDPDLIKEITPWLKEFTNLGKIGESQIVNYRAKDENPKTYWNLIENHQKETVYNRTYELGDSVKVQVTTGSAVLRPLIKSFEVWNNKQLLSKLTGNEDIEVLNPELGRLETPIKPLQDLKVIAETENKIRLQTILEVFVMEPGESFMILLTAPMQKGRVKFHYNSGYYNWLKIETSADGEHWENAKFEEKNWQQAEFDFNKTVKYVRISNKDKEMIDLRLFEFSLIETPVADNFESYLVHDLDVFTATELKSGETLVERSSSADASEVVILTGDDTVNLKLEGKEADGEWEEFPESYKGKLIEIDLPSSYNAIRIKSDADLKIYEVIWK